MFYPQRKYINLIYRAFPKWANWDPPMQSKSVFYSGYLLVTLCRLARYRMVPQK